MKNNYLAWNLSEEDFPYDGSLVEKIRALENYGLLAPSVYNTQPWKTTIEKQSLIIYPDYSKELKYADPERVGMFIALGAFVENILQAADIFGIKSSRISVENNKVIIKFHNSQNVTKKRIPTSIINRFSAKVEFLDKSIDKVTLEELKKHGANGVKVHVIAERSEMQKVQDFHKDATHEFSKNYYFVRELTAWLRPNNTRKEDGMPGFVAGHNLIKSILAGKILKIFPQIFARSLTVDHALFCSASAYIVVSSPSMDCKNLLDCGRVVERLWLSLNDKGIAVHPMTAIIHSQVQNKKLQDFIHTKNQPAFLMRIGILADSHRITHTPRRKDIRAA